MKSKNGIKSDLGDEQVNIAIIRTAEQAQKEAIASAKKKEAVKIAAALQEVDKVKEKVINDARNQRKAMIQKAIDRAKNEAKVIVEEQVRTTDALINRGQKSISSAAEFAVKYILGTDQENVQ